MLKKEILIIIIFIIFQSFLYSQNLEIKNYTNSNNNKKNIEKILQENWYNPNLDYISISTTKDGIGLFNGSDILKIFPEWANKPLNYFHLIHNGVEVPVRIDNDKDFLLDNNDLFVFISSRASGDTTFYNNYTNESLFYLCYDESSAGLRYFENSDMPEPDEELISIPFYKHFEIEKEYLYGYDYTDVENTAGEGWAWELINPNQKNIFIDSTIFSNIGVVKDSLKVRIEFYSAAFNSDFDLNHKLRVVLNGDTLKTQEFKGGIRGVLSFELASSQIFPGTNVLEVITLGYPNTDPKSTLKYTNPDDVGIDFIIVEGVSSPIDFQDGFSYKIEKSREDRKIKTYQKSKNSFNLDKTNNISLKHNSLGGSYLRIGTKSLNPYSSFTINDKYHTSAKRGFHILSLNAPSYNEYKHITFENIDNSIVSYLNSIPNESVIGITYNSQQQIPTELRNLIESMGSKEIKNLKNFELWSFILKKGDNLNTNESKTISGISKINGFIEHNNSKYSQNTYYLPREKNFDIVFSTIYDTSQTVLNKVNKTNLRSNQNIANALIISHLNFKAAADSLASYRMRANPELVVMSIDANDVYKEFNYGIKSPHSIKNFLEYIFKNWKSPRPKYLNLFGDASWDCRKIKPTSINIDYLPTYGYPASDYWYSLVEGDDYIPEISVGRIPVISLEQAFNYVKKLIEYDTIPNNPWMKNMLFLSGGDGLGQMTYFSEVLKSLARTLYNSPMCIDTFLIPKRDPTVGGEAEAGEIIQRINQGMGWVTFLGHGSTSVFDMDGWQVEKLNNKGKYGFLTTLSCATGAFAEPEITTRNEYYVLNPNKGFIAAGGGTYVGFADYVSDLHKRVLFTFIDSSSKLDTYIELLDRNKVKLVDTDKGKFVIMTYALLGDPMTKIRIKQKPDLYFQANSIVVKNIEGETIITDNDSIAYISGKIGNSGYIQSNPIPVYLIRKYENSKPDTLIYELNEICSTESFNIKLDVIDKPGIHNITLVIDPLKTLIDVDYSNNTNNFMIEVFTQGLLALDPFPYWDVSPKNPVFRFINPLSKDYKFEYQFEIISNFENDIATVLKYSEPNEIEVKENYLEWKPEVTLPESSNLWLWAKAKNLDLNKISKRLSIPFNVNPRSVNENVIWNLKGKNQLLSLSTSNFEIDSASDQPQLITTVDKIPYRILSIRGTNQLERFSEISIGNKIYITTPPLHRGFNLVVMDNKTLEGKITRIYDTWEDDSSSIKLVKFLRDSIPDDHSIMLATCDESFRIPIHHITKKTIGSLDTLRNELSKFGSALIDSIRVPTGEDVIFYSFAMLGRKGAEPGTIPEKINPTGDSAYIEGEFIVHPEIAQIETSIIGPAKSWHNIKFDGNLLNDTSELKVEITGFDKYGGNSKLIGTFKNQNTINLQDIFSNEFPYLKFKIIFNRNAAAFSPSLKSINSEFSASPEFAIVHSKSFIKKDSLMRGQDAEYEIAVENISKRQASDETEIKVRLYSNTGDLGINSIKVKSLKPDELITLEDNTITDNFSISSFLSATINDTLKVIEPYSFNNKFETRLKIYEDKIKPSVLLMLDSQRVHDGDYVPIRPRMDITLYDNSPMVIDNRNKLQLRINARWQDTKDFPFISFGRNVPKKAHLSYQPDSLDYGENIIRVYSEDASGNRDTLYISVFVSQNGFLVDILNAPNPFSSHTYFDFNYLAPNHKGIAQVDIFNSSGQKVRTIEQELFLGKNQIYWDATDDNKNSIPSGVYFFRIVVNSEVYVEPIFGKCLYVK